MGNCLLESNKLDLVHLSQLKGMSSIYQLRNRDLMRWYVFDPIWKLAAVACVDFQLEWDLQHIFHLWASAMRTINGENAITDSH